MAMDDPGLNSNGLTLDEQTTFDNLYGTTPKAAPPPAPGTFAGLWKGLAGIPSGAAHLGLDVYGDVNAAARGAVDKFTGAHDFRNLAGEPEGYGAGTPFKAAPDTLRSKADEAADETAQQVADLQQSVTDTYRPNAATTGTAGNLLFGALDTATRIGLGTVLTRGTAGVEVAAGSIGQERTQELEAQGVDAGTAAEEGAISAGSFEAMGAVGAEGGSLATRVLKSAAANEASGIGSRAADSAILQANGYQKLAEQEQWNDAQAMISDAIVGMAFPLVHAGFGKALDSAANAREARLTNKIIANPELFDTLHDGTGYVPAANVDAALTSLNARQVADSAPGVPTDFASQGLHHKALDAAIRQAVAGDDVNVEPIVRAMNTIPRPVDPAKAEGFGEALADAQYPDVAAERDERIAGVQSLDLPDETRAGLIGMYQQAAQTKPVFDEAVQGIADAVGGTAQLAPLKGHERAAEKVVSDYAGDASKIKDLVRATISVDRPDQVDAAIARAQAAIGGKVKRNSLTGEDQPSEEGYRDVLINGDVGGHRVELQINYPEMLDAKHELHQHYKEASGVQRRASDENRKLTDKEAQRIADLRAKQVVGYSAAWEATKARNLASGSSVPLWANDDSGNLRPPGTSQAVASNPSADTGTSSTSANRVPSGNEAGNLTGSIAPTSNEILTQSRPENDDDEPEGGAPITPRPSPNAPAPATGADTSIRSSDAAYGTPDRHPWVEIDDTHNIPLAGGVSANGRTVYVSRYMPKTVEIDGKTIDAHEGVTVHEVEEQKVMLPDGPKDAEYMAALKADIASEAKANPKSPKVSKNDLKKVARGVPLPYPKAHAIATIRENAFIRAKYRIDPEKYQKALADGIETARKKAASEGDIPADLDTKPYVDSDLTKLLPTKPGGPLMQNRDRARAASLTQMAGIANAPDAQRLGFSRDPNTGAPMVSAENAAQAVPEVDQGKQDVVIFADGRKVPVRYAVVEAGDVAASHNADGSKNPDYNGSKLQALNNGRVAGVQAAWSGGHGDAYKAGLIADAGMFGIDPKAIEDKAHPMVIRLYDAAANFGDMGKASNDSSSLGLSPSEQAMTDARALPDLDTLPLTESGEISGRADDGFHRAFLKNLGMNDASKLVDASGRFNKTYLDRLRAAMFARAYGDPALVEMQTESTDPVSRNALNALTAAAPEWAKVDQGAPLGDYASRITAAMNLLREAHESGETVAQRLAQGDLIARDTRGDKWAKFFADNIRSPKRVGEALRDAARMVVAEQRRLLNGDLIGGGGRDESDITQTVLQIAGDRYGHEQPRPTGSLFNAAGRPSRDAAARPAADVARERTGEQAEGEGTQARDAAAAGRAAPESQPAAAPDAGRPADASTDGLAGAADASATGGTAGEAGGPQPAEPDRAAQDQEGRGGTRPDTGADRDLARARQAIAQRPDLTLPEGLTAAEAMRQADEEVTDAEKQADAIKAAVNCFLSFGSDAA